MKIKNPVNQEISIQYQGVVYTIPALGSISGVKEEVATYWKTMIHEFIQVSEDEIVSEKKEEMKEVVVEEEPVIKEKSTKKK